MNGIKAAFVAVIGLFVLTASLGSFYQIDEGERGVVVRNGKITGVSGPGLHWKMPIITDVYKISVRDQIHPYPYFEVYTRDQQVATVKVSMTYRVKPHEVATVYSQFGSVENVRARLFDPRIPEELEKVFGQFNAERAVQSRAELGMAYASNIKAIESPFEIVSVQIENFSLPDDYEATINERMKAEVEVQRLQQQHRQAEEQAKITVTNAEAEAEAIRKKGQAEAEAIRLRGNALRDNPGIIELAKAERWNGVLPTTMLPNSTVPFLSK